MVFATFFVPFGVIMVFFGLCTVLLGCGAGDGAGALPALVRFCSTTIPGLAYRGLERAGVTWLLGRLFGLLEALLNKPNPTIQIGYLAIVCGAFEAFRRFGFPILYQSPHAAAGQENPYFSSARIAEAYAIFAATLASFALACFTDPGVVTAANAAGYQALHAYDGVLFSAAAPPCATCKIPKPARSKHCKVCDRCVSKFDHHWCVCWRGGGALAAAVAAISRRPLLALHPPLFPSCPSAPPASG